jgi:hypothetical protein
MRYIWTLLSLQGQDVKALNIGSVLTLTTSPEKNRHLDIQVTVFLSLRTAR